MLACWAPPPCLSQVTNDLSSPVRLLWEKPFKLDEQPLRIIQPVRALSLVRCGGPVWSDFSP